MNQTQNNDGGPAFPCPVGHIECKHPEGMSLRDYIAIKAMQGWLASYSKEMLHPTCSGSGSLVSEWSYKLADAMLYERDRRGN